MVKLTDHEDISRETIRRRLVENDLKPWRREMWCVPEVDAEYVARMEDVLDLYNAEPDSKRPVVCFDESPTQLIGEAREPIPADPGQLARFDCEYRRNGTANLFVFLDAHKSWRKVKVTDRRAAEDFAGCMRDLVDLHYPKAEKIRVVLDNLSTHSPSALYQTFPAPEARRILRRFRSRPCSTNLRAWGCNGVRCGVGKSFGDRRHAESDHIRRSDATRESAVIHSVADQPAAIGAVTSFTSCTRRQSSQIGRA